MIEVLIVEDDPMVSKVNEMYLDELDGFHLSGTAFSVQEAIDFIEEKQIDLILLDIFMPEKDGFYLLSYIRQSEKDIDIIVISAASDTKSIHKALQNGAVDYILKPFQFDRFKNALFNFKEKKRIVSEKEELSQSQLDQLLLDSKFTDTTATLPKGLTKYTLKQILDYIKTTNEAAFSTEDLAEAIGVSRISVRKYLTFLEKIDVLSSFSEYGNIGRPLTVFKLSPKNIKKVEIYLKET